jgi:hypothetical protein
MSTKTTAAQTELNKLMDEVSGMMSTVCQEQAWSWEKFKVNINNEIERDSGTYSALKSVSKDTWKRYQKDGGGTLGPDYWKELKNVLTQFIPKKEGENLKNNNQQVTLFKCQDWIKYSTPKFQETLIPLLYKHAYTVTHKVIFKTNIDWSVCMEAFGSGDINVAIHNFPTVIASIEAQHAESPFFFWPFLTFDGYVLLVKLKAEHQPTNGKPWSFDTLTKEEKRNILEEYHVIIERNTDVEWVFKQYVGKYNFNWERIVNNIRPFSVNEGKTKFTDWEHGVLYCTNTFHLSDLRKKNLSGFNIVAVKPSLTTHENYSGLVCTWPFFIDNVDLIRSLILIWFENIKHFKNDWNYVGNGEEDEHFHFRAFLDLLNTETGSHLAMPELIDTYRKCNEFFPSPDEAHKRFLQDVLENNDHFKNNYEIAKVQSNNEIGDSDAVLLSIKNMMIKAKNLLGFTK